MILYNTLMGFCAGLITLLVVDLVRRVRGGTVNGMGYGAAFVALGLPLTVLSGAMALTWPLNVNPPINIAFAEPGLVLGVLALVAGWWLLRRLPRDQEITMNVIPVKAVIGALGLMLLTISTAIFSYDLVGDAPPQEPITGQFTGWENTFFGVLYLVAALGCLFATQLNLEVKRHWPTTLALVFWTLAGVGFLAFSLLNYRTHIGLLINFERGTNYRW